MNNKQNSRQTRVVLSTLLCGVALGSLTTLLCLRVRGVSLVPGTSSPAFQKFFRVYNDLETQYYKPIPESQLLDGAVNGMTESLGDKFSEYFPPAAATSFSNMLNSQFDGIGVTVESVPTGFLVMSVLPSTPAEKAGIQPHDIITEVGSTSIAGMDENKALNLITGPDGSKVTIVIHRPSDGRNLSFRLRRTKITQPSVQTQMLPHHVGYLVISIIGENTATEVSTGLAQLHVEGATKLIVDLRDNGGGYLDQALKIAGDFIPKGQVVLYTAGRGQAPLAMQSPGPGTRLPIVVLLNQNTASAAEVLSAALHDDLGAPLVGVKSYGKGTVQQIEDFEDGSEVKYTVDKWLTPKHEWIHGKGIVPTVMAPLPAFVNFPALSSAHLPLHDNQNNADVATLQKYLAALGYKVDRTDGYFDSSTVAAVKSYQLKEHLQDTGVVDANTAANLTVDLGSLIQDSDTQLEKAKQVISMTSTKQ